MSVNRTTSRTAKNKRAKCPIKYGFNYEGQARAIWCGQWYCPHCSKTLAKRWASDVAYHINSAQTAASLLGMSADFFFVTFTLGSHVKKAPDGFRAIVRLWDRFRKAMQRHYPGWQYAAFVEGQPKRGGMPHFHVISGKQLPITPNKHGRVTKHMVHDYAHSMGWGFEADQKPVDGPRAGWYVAKYASKQSPHTPRGFRRVRVSQDWQRKPRTSLLALIVQARGETDDVYCLRVSGLSGVDLPTIRSRFQVTKQMLDADETRRQDARKDGENHAHG